MKSNEITNTVEGEEFDVEGSSYNEPFKKKPRVSKSSQIFAIPTYDATFKYLMSEEEICISFLRSFIPDDNISKIKHLDCHLRPFKEFQKARGFLNNQISKQVIQEMVDLIGEEEEKDNCFSISFNGENGITKEVHGGGQFIHGLMEIYGDLLRSYPKPQRNSQVDLICKVNEDYYALVEVQVIPQDFWDKRALAYAANFYGRQLREGEEWNKVKKVACINILGGGPKDMKWASKRGFNRFNFRDQENKELEKGIEVTQYSLFHEELKKEASERKTEEGRREYLEWLDFLEHAHNKKEEDVKKVKTTAVKKAYERIKETQLPEEVKMEYKREEEEFKKYSQHTEYLKQQAGKKEGIEEGKKEGIEVGKKEGIEEGMEKERMENVKSMIVEGFGSDVISRITKMPHEEIEKIRNEMC